MYSFVIYNGSCFNMYVSVNILNFEEIFRSFSTMLKYLPSIYGRRQLSLTRKKIRPYDAPHAASKATETRCEG